MGVPHGHHPVATVQVDVLVSVGVVDLGAGTVTDPDGLGPRDLPARGHPSGQRPPGTRRELGRTLLSAEEGRLLFRDEDVKAGEIGFGNPGGDGHLSILPHVATTAEEAFRRSGGTAGWPAVTAGSPMPHPLSVRGSRVHAESQPAKLGCIPRRISDGNVFLEGAVVDRQE